MHWTRLEVIGLVLVASASLCCSWRSATATDAHTQARQFVIQSTLDRFPDPIVVLGDSIVEASTLPRSLCGHAIVNAGIGGASTTSDLGSMLAKSLGDKRAALVVLSLGTNDAGASRSTEAFKANYRSLLKQLSTLAAHTVIMAIPTVEGNSEIGNRISNYNSVLPDLAKEEGAVFSTLPVMPEPHTFDSVHLNAAGYEVWDQTVMRGAATICSGSK
jgi:lysophospholipase L1-like esterase